MPKITIDGKEYEVPAGKNLLEVILSLGINLQYFCWHPALGSVGACRQCAVSSYKDPNSKGGKLIMSCMEIVRDNMIISIEDPESKEFRKGVIEWLMTNHPHDCPVCDEGGECHLQDMTYMSGHNYRRFRFPKRTYKNQYLGPFINHEMNRCIQCYRCVRFYRDYANGNDLDVFAIRNTVYFGRAEDGVLENEFSGNLIEVCPTGVFTDKTLQEHYTRKWDLTSAPSVCVNCSVGCNTLASERYGTLRRILSRYNGKVNGYFLCDRGRFGYEFVNSNKRIKHPLFRDKNTGNLSVASEGMILNEIRNILKKGNLIGIGSPRASLESNYMLKKLVGNERFYSGVSAADQKLLNLTYDILKKGSVRTPSLKETEKADAVLILGEDVINTAPMLGLSLMQAALNKPKAKAAAISLPLWQDAAVRELIQDEKGPFYILSPYKTKLDKVSTGVYRTSPDNIARLGFGLANLISNSATLRGFSEDETNLLKEISSALLDSAKPLIVSGMSLRSESVIQAAANIAWALKAAGKPSEIVLTVPENNSLGVTMLGGKNLNDILSADIPPHSTAVILENDLYRRDDKKTIQQILGKFENIIAIDSLGNETTRAARYVIPAGTFAESEGTFVNYEGRAQRFFQVYMPEEPVKESWRWINKIAESASTKKKEAKNSFESILNQLNSEPLFSGVASITPPPGYRIADRKIAREPHRFSGRTAMHADRSVHEPKPPVDNDSALTFTMEGHQGDVPSSMIPFFWSPGWNSAQAINKYQIEVGGPLHGGDPGLRLIEPSGGSPVYFKDVPTKYTVSPGEILLVPLYHIFGSEELSSYSPSVGERIPRTKLLCSSKTFSSMGLGDESDFRIRVQEDLIDIVIEIDDSMQEGIAALSSGLPESVYINLPLSVPLKGIKE